MANTVTTLSYANTFGQWLTATGNLIGENNILAKGDYTKDTGTLYLSETTKSSLQANGNVVVTATPSNYVLLTQSNVWYNSGLGTATDGTGLINSTRAPATFLLAQPGYMP